MNVITKEELKEQLAHELPNNEDMTEGYALVFVGSAEEFAVEHIPHSVNIPQGEEEEFEEELFRPYSFVMSKFHTRSGRDGTIGVIGPARLQYDRVNPWVRYVASLIEDVADW